MVGGWAGVCWGPVATEHRPLQVRSKLMGLTVSYVLDTGMDGITMTLQTALLVTESPISPASVDSRWNTEVRRPPEGFQPWLEPTDDRINSHDSVWMGAGSLVCGRFAAACQFSSDVCLRKGMLCCRQRSRQHDSV